MADSRTKKVRYRKQIMHKGAINGTPYLEYDYDWHEASVCHIKRFQNAIYLLVGVDGCERNLIDWLVDNMTASNYVTNSEVTRNAFINFHKKYKKDDKKAYAQNTVKTAFQRLSASGLLIQVTRGTYLVNPDYFFAGTDEQRFNSIKMVLEFKAGLHTEVNLDITEKK